MSNSITHYDSGRLSDSALELLKKSRDVTDTDKQYRSHFQIFMRWRDFKGAHGSPTAVDLINFMADQFKGELVMFDERQNKLVDGNPISPSTIDARRWGIIKVLSSKGVTFTKEELASISEYIRQLKISAGDQTTSRRRGQAAPLRWPTILRLLKSAKINDGSKFQTLRDKALLCFMATSGCRESEACGSYGVRQGDFFIYSDRIEYRRIVLKAGNRDYKFRGAIAKTEGACEAECPYSILKAYIEYVRTLDGINSNTKLFLRSDSSGKPLRTKSRGELKPLGVYSIDDKLKDWAFSAGLPWEVVEQVSGHSLRMGLVVDQVELGKSFEFVSKITGQSITTVERYALQAQMAPFEVDNREGA